MSDTSETTRCPCGSDEELHISKKDKVAWVSCKERNVWQHPICVGLLDEQDLIPDDYFCEECKPQHHGRFKFGPGLDDPDNRVDIAKERQRIWLINGLMAIVEGHSASLAAPYIFVSGLSEDVWKKADSFGRMLILSIRIVLRNAEFRPLLEFEARLDKVRFNEALMVARQVWTLRKWLTPEFMGRMENQSMEELLEECSEEEKEKWQGVERMGEASANTSTCSDEA
jgi:hypothetical protein